MDTATPRTARAINDRVALDLLVDRGPLTATQLKEATGLSRPSVADLLARLQDAGLVAPAGMAGSERRGPNARLYGLVADRAHVAALDVRPEGVTAALADLTGHTVAEAALATEPSRSPAGAPDGDAAAVRTALDRLRRAAGVTAVHTAVVGAPGLAVPSTVPTAGAHSGAGSARAGHSRLVAMLRGDLGASTEVHVENEVNLAGIAEHRTGVAVDRATFALLWLGRGVGAALVLDGALRRGASGGAGEIGFLPVPGVDSRLFTAPGCPADAGRDTGAGVATSHGGGATDDLCALLSAAAVHRLADQYGIRASPAVSDPAPGTPPATDPAEEAAAAVVRAARGSGPDGAAFLDALADRVALAGAALTAVLDPGCLVLGGLVGCAGKGELADRVASRLRRVSPLRTEVRAGTVRDNAVLTGALLTGLDHARDAVFSAPVTRT